MASKIWVGGAVGDTANWNNPGNWSPAGVPVVGDTITVPSAAIFQPAVLPFDTAVFGGPVTNAGTISLGSTGSFANLVIGADTTLTGGGTVSLTDSLNQITSNSAFTLFNIDNSIKGAGAIASSNLSLDNQAAGTIDANVFSNPLSVAVASLSNEGVFRAENGAILAVQADASHVFTNLSADPAHTGSDVLTGGTYDVVDPAMFGSSTISFNGVNALPVTTLNANVILSGATSLLLSGSIDLQTSLVAIGTGGGLNLWYGTNSASTQNFVDPNAVAIDGALNLHSANFTAAQITVDTGGLVGGSGNLTASGGSIVNNGSIVASLTNPAFPQPSSLVVTGNVTGTSGTLEIQQSATLELAGASTAGAGETVKFDLPTLTAPNINPALLPLTLANPAETLKIDESAVNATTFAAPIKGFAVGDTIDLTGIGFVAGETYSFTGNTLTVLNGATTLATLQFSDLATGTQFNLAADAGTGTAITVTDTTFGIPGFTLGSASFGQLDLSPQLFAVSSALYQTHNSGPSFVNNTLVGISADGVHFTPVDPTIHDDKFLNTPGDPKISGTYMDFYVLADGSFQYVPKPNSQAIINAIEANELAANPKPLSDTLYY